ncbi:MAG TPA: hypothetical protein VF040_03530 [Ktedonobacterales bacterium]
MATGRISSCGPNGRDEPYGGYAEPSARLIPLGVVAPAQAARLLYLPPPERSFRVPPAWPAQADSAGI